jgi:hypothetical protein
MRLPASICVFSAMLLPGTAMAQAGAAGAEDLAAMAPAGRTENPLNGISFDLDVNDEESKASVQIGGNFVRSIIADGEAHRTDATWSMKLAVPVGGTDDLTSGKTLDALGDGPKLTVNIGLLGFRSATQNLFSKSFLDIMADARVQCTSAVTRNTELQGQARIDAFTDCDANPDPEFAEKYSRSSDAAINRSLLSGFWHAGVEASVSVKRFGYLDATTLGDLHDTKLQYAAAVYGALYPADAMTAIIGKVEYERGFKAADEAIVCKPVVVDPTKDCAKGVPTAPTRTENLNLSLEFRRVFDSGWKPGSFAVSPKGTIDALSGEYELELPVYFIPRGDLPVAPGFKVSYSSEKDKVAFGLFLRSTFSF